MTLEIHEIKDLISKNITGDWRDSLSVQVAELTGELNEEQVAPVLYELGSRNPIAAFALWLTVARKENPQAFSTMFPEKFSLSTGRPLEYAPAFRELDWIETSEVRSIDDEKHTVYRAAILAGVKKEAFRKTRSFAENRIQGGRAISDWTLVHQMLSELYLEIQREKMLIERMDFPVAMALVGTADLFISKCMQVFGGAGYIEDYDIEKLFRTCHFLKNWPAPYRETLQRINPLKGEL